MINRLADALLLGLLLDAEVVTFCLWNGWLEA
jgi:hypothetical protein